MIQNKNCIFKIKISDSYQIQCCILSKNNDTETIQFNINDLNINSNLNSFQFEKNIFNFVQDLINTPEEYKEYSIIYQQKEYNVISEVIISLIINEFKQKIEKEYIIEETIIEIQNQNETLLKRIQISLQAIGIYKQEIEILDDKLQKKYSEQGEFLNEIIEKKSIYDKYQRMIERAKQLTENKHHLQLLESIQNKIVNEETFEKEIIQFTPQERTQMKLTSLDNYCIFISSRYFKNIEDHKNLTKVSRRMKGNMDKFHYNPISLNYNEKHLFPNVETFHTYFEDDEYLIGGRILHYIDWVKRDFVEKTEIEQDNLSIEIEFKNIVYSSRDIQNQIREINPNVGFGAWINIYIPDGVTKIDNYACDEYLVEGDDKIHEIHISSTVKKLGKNCFNFCRIEDLIIPETVKSIPEHCFESCNNLTNITIPLNETRVMYSDKIFNDKSHFCQAIRTPQTIKIINGKKVEKLTSLEVPSFVTSIDEKCFSDCVHLKILKLPKSIKDVNHNLFIKTPSLEELYFSSDYSFYDYKLFNLSNQCLYSISLPKSIKKVNDKEMKPLETFTIPSNVTKLSDYCFSNCESLTEIKGLEHVKEIGKGCFMNCPKLNKEQYPEIKQNVNNYLNELFSQQEQKQLEEWTGLKCNDIIFDSNKDNCSQYISELNERILGKKQLVFLIENDDGERFGFYMNPPLIETCENWGIIADFKSFHFNLKSKNNRLPQPMKFEIKNIYYGVTVNYKSHWQLMQIGQIEVGKFFEEEKYHYNSYTWQSDEVFDYHDIWEALCGKCGLNYFKVVQIQILEMI